MEALHGLFCPHTLAQNIGSILSFGGLVLSAAWAYLRRQ